MDTLVSTGNGPAIDSSASMKSSRIMVWRFTEAPRRLRVLHRDLPPPEWLVLVPQALICSDLDESITRRAESSRVSRYKTPAGDAVYTGTSPMNQAGKHLRTARAESAASMHSHG